MSIVLAVSTLPQIFNLCEFLDPHFIWKMEIMMSASGDSWGLQCTKELPKVTYTVGSPELHCPVPLILGLSPASPTDLSPCPYPRTVVMNLTGLLPVCSNRK